MLESSEPKAISTSCLISAINLLVRCVEAGVPFNHTDWSGVRGNTDNIEEQRLILPVQSPGSRNDAVAMSDHIRSSVSKVTAQVTSDAVPAGLEPIDAGEIRINTNFLNSENPCLAYGREDKVDTKLGAMVSFSEITYT
jgi:hypothetical protein